jgi:transaldolase
LKQDYVLINQDEMANEKLSEGIRLFGQYTVSLENEIKKNFIQK